MIILIRRRNSIAIRFTSAANSTRLSENSRNECPHHDAERHSDKNVLGKHLFDISCPPKFQLR